MKCLMFSIVVAACLVGSQAMAATIDGQNIPSEGLPLLSTQTNPTNFGNATGGGQDSAGGSELNQLFGEISGGTLKLGLTGNLEGNFNKLWIFFDAVNGGEDPLGSDNNDGGFGEINNLAGLSLGSPMDHALRFEVGGGFLGIRYADLIDNVGGDIFTDGGGTGALPLTNQAGNLGVTIGWDNSNVLGVDGSSAAGAATATTGIELEIDTATFFGQAIPGVRVSAFVTNGDASFISNQVLPLNGTVTIGNPIPEPSAIACLALAGLGLIRRRRA